MAPQMFRQSFEICIRSIDSNQFRIDHAARNAALHDEVTLFFGIGVHFSLPRHLMRDAMEPFDEGGLGIFYGVRRLSENFGKFLLNSKDVTS